MQMESYLKFRSPKTIPGASQQNSVVSFSWLTEAHGDLF